MPKPGLFGTLRPAQDTPLDTVTGLFSKGLSALGMDEHAAYRLGHKLAGVTPAGLSQIGTDAGNSAVAAGNGHYGLAGGLAANAGIGLAMAAAPGLDAVAPEAEGAVASAAPSLFDMSRLHEVPDVPQTDLPRYVPPRGVSQRVQDVTSNPDVRDKALQVIERGKQLGGANWYNADPLRDAFVKQLGEDTGGDAFSRYMDYVAASSPRSKVGDNVRNASYYYMRDMSGEGLPKVGDKNPQPYGHLAQRLHQMNANGIVDNGGWDPLKNPKPASFAQNLMGNQQPVTVDTHAFRLPAVLSQDPRFLTTAFKPDKDAPSINYRKMVESGDMSMTDALNRPAIWDMQPKDNEYGAMENFYRGLGQDAGLTPAQTQASAWVGGAQDTGLGSDPSKPFLGFFNDRVHLTAQKLNMDPQDVLKHFIAGKLPLLSVPAAAAGATALASGLPQDQQQQDQF